MTSFYRRFSEYVRKRGFAACAALAASFLSPIQVAVVHAAEGRFFEMRVYTTHEGKLDDLHKRFREQTNRLFVKHGMSLIGYWTPTEGPESKNTLVYILAYPSREARDASWEAFRSDPEWHRIRDESEKNGKIVQNVKSTFLVPTDYSPIQ